MCVSEYGSVYMEVLSVEASGHIGSSKAGVILSVGCLMWVLGSDLWKDRVYY